MVDDMPTWDPNRYLQFSDDRTRPFVDLVTQIPGSPESIVDLGCGPGHLTRFLRARWPGADILGVDSSPEMIDRASSDDDDPHARYAVADVSVFRPDHPVDLIVSNAMFQWIPDQFEVIGELLGSLTEHGGVAIQVPNNAASATHQTLARLADTEPYRDHLRDARRLPGIEPQAYLEFFAHHGFMVNAWSTTYLHVLAGDDPVFDWISGTGARPFLQALDGDLRERFTAELKAALREAYPAQPWGTVLPFTRTFVVASKG